MKKIMIVTEFGDGAENESMLSLKEAIESRGNYSVKVVDIMPIVLTEHIGENLNDAKIMDLSVSKLNELSAGFDTMVVFCKSVLLADNIGSCDVLFVNPEFDEDWPWKKLYYHTKSHLHEFDYDSSSRHYALFTTANHSHEFRGRYSGFEELATELEGNTDGLAEFICLFADDKLIFPMEEVFKALATFHNTHSFNEECMFKEPLPLLGRSAVGIVKRMPMAEGQSMYKIKFAEKDYPSPIEIVETRRDLLALRDAIINA